MLIFLCDIFSEDIFLKVVGKFVLHVIHLNS